MSNNSGLTRDAPLISKLANWGPFQHSIWDHSPVNYLRASFAKRIGAELESPEGGYTSVGSSTE